MAINIRQQEQVSMLPPPVVEGGLSSPDVWLEEHGNHLLRYAYSRVRNTHVAEELVQETFIAALKGRQRFSGLSSERTWFIGILRHKIIDYFRKSSRERAVADIEALPDPEEHHYSQSGRWATSPEAWTGDPEKAAENSNFWRVLKDCIAGLPRNLADAFVLREVQGLDSDEVCKILDITPNNLWVRLHRARAQLRGSLEKRWYGNQDSSNL